MAFRLGHQITCNINKNLFFRNSSASARRYRSLSRGHEARVQNEEDAAAVPEAIRARNSRARSQPRSSVPNATRRDYSTEAPFKQQHQQRQQQQKQQSEQPKTIIVTKNAFRRSPACYSLQPKNLPPMATTHIHINNNFAPMDELQDVRPYENRLGEVKRQASVKYEQAVRTFNISSRGPGPSSGYRYELDAARPKVEKGTNVYNVVAAIKSREQSVAAQAPQLQPKNIKPYGDIMTKPWCTQIMERIKHKPLSMTRLEEAIHKSILRRPVTVKLPETVNDKKMDISKPNPTVTASESTSVTRSDKAAPPSLSRPTNAVQSNESTLSKHIDQSLRRAYSTICKADMSSSAPEPENVTNSNSIKEYNKTTADNSKYIDSSSSENKHAKVIVDTECKFAKKLTSSQPNRLNDKASEHDFVPKKRDLTPSYAVRNVDKQIPCPKSSGPSAAKVVFYNNRGPTESFMHVKNQYKDRITLNANEIMDDSSLLRRNIEKQLQNAEPIKIRVGPKMKLQSWNIDECADGEKALIPGSGEKFVVPWLSWGDRVKLKKQNAEISEKVNVITKPNVIPSPVVKSKETKPSATGAIQVRSYSSSVKDETSASLPLSKMRDLEVEEKAMQLENVLAIPTHKDFVAEIDWPVGGHILNFRNKAFHMNVRSYSTGIPDECIHDAKPPPKPKEVKAHDPWCDPTHFAPTQTNPECRKGCILGPEYTVMVNLRRLPKIKIPDPIRYCPEPCDTAVRADDGLKIEQKQLPRLVVKPCPPVPKPCLTDVPLVRLKKREAPPIVRVCPPPPCGFPRADDGMKVVKKALPKLVPKMCGRCEEVVMTTPPLFRLKAKPVPPPKPCIPPSCPEPPITRADAGMKVVRKNLPVLTPPCCPRICNDNLVDGPPLKRLRCYAVREPEKICPCIPTVRDPCCPPRADEICNYTVQKKQLPSMILSERYNEISTADFARVKRARERRFFSTYSKCDMCCYSDKKVQPDLESIKNDIRPTVWEDFKGYLAAGKDGSIEAYDTTGEVIDNSTGAELRIIRKPIGGVIMKKDNELRNRLLKGGYSARFGDMSQRNCSSTQTVSRKVDCETPPEPHVPFKYPKLKRLKKREGFDEDFPDVPHKSCQVVTCAGTQIVDPPPRMDAIMNYKVTSKILPTIPAGNCKKVIVPPAKRLIALVRPKKRFHYGDEPYKCAEQEVCPIPRADDSAPVKQKKLPPVPKSEDTKPVKKMAYRDCKKLPRLHLDEEDPPRHPTLPPCGPAVVCGVRADDGKELVRRKSLPILHPADCPPQQTMKYRDCKPLKRLPPHPFMERDPCPPLAEDCTLVVRADESLKEVVKPLPPLLKNDGKLLRLPEPPPCPPGTTRRKYSTLSSNFMYNENFTQFARFGRHLSRTSIFRSKDCKIKKEEKKAEKRIPKFALPNCKPRTEPPFCDREPIYPECTKQKSPYPSFSECKDEDPYLGLTECPPNNKYLQPKFPLIGELIILKPPPPAQKKIDPKLEEECIIKKLNLKREGFGTRTCEDFHTPYVPLRAKNLLKSAMKQATVTHAEEECKANLKKKKTDVKTCAKHDDSTCTPGKIECELIGKDQPAMICADSEKKKKKLGEPGALICRGSIKDCSPKPAPAKEPPKKVPCKPYVLRPGPPKKIICKKPMICEPPANSQADKKKEGGKKAAITSKINRPIKGGNGGTNSSGGGQIRNVGGGGGGAEPRKVPLEDKQAKDESDENHCKKICGGGKDKEESHSEKPAKAAKAKEPLPAKCGRLQKACSAPGEKPKGDKSKGDKSKSAKSKCDKPKGDKPKGEKSKGERVKCDKPKSDKSKQKKVCSGDKSGAPKKPKPKKTCDEVLKKKDKKEVKKSLAIKCKEPAQAVPKKSIAIKCSPIKKSPVPMKPKCPVQPAPIIAAVCPKKSLWDKILDFFRARPNCPAPDQWKKDKLKREAERAAAAAGFDLCEKKKVFVCAVKATSKGLKEHGKQRCPFPPPPPPPKKADAKSKEQEKGRVKCVAKVKECGGSKRQQKAGAAKNNKGQSKFKCKPRNKGSKKPPKDSGKCTFSRGPSSRGQSTRRSSSRTRCIGTLKKKTECSSVQMSISSCQSALLETSSYTRRTRDLPYTYCPECTEGFHKLPISDCIGRSGIFPKGKYSIDLTPKQTRAYSMTLVRHYSSPNDEECNKGFVPPRSACKLPKPKHCAPNPRGFDCTLKTPFPPCTPIEAPYPCFSDCQKECCKTPRTECFEQSRIFQRQKALGLLAPYNMRKRKSKKHYSTVQNEAGLVNSDYTKQSKRYSFPFKGQKCISFVPKRDFSMVTKKNSQKVYSSHLTPLTVYPQWGRNENKVDNFDILSQEKNNRLCKEKVNRKGDQILSSNVCQDCILCNAPADLATKSSVLESVKRFFSISQNATPVFAPNDLLDGSDRWSQDYRAFSVEDESTPVRVSTDLKVSADNPREPSKQTSLLHRRMYAATRQIFRSYASNSDGVFKRKAEMATSLKQRNSKKRTASVRFYSDDEEPPKVSAEKECPKITPAVKGKCKLPKPPTCGPNPRGFDCTYKTPYAPCTSQQAPYPSFSECQKECCKRARNECTEQDTVFEKQKRTGQLDMCNIRKTSPKDYGHKTDGAKEYSTLAKREFSSFVGSGFPSNSTLLQVVPGGSIGTSTKDKLLASPLQDDNEFISNDEKLRLAARQILCSDIEHLSDSDFKELFLAASKFPGNTYSNTALWNKGYAGDDLKASFLADTVKRFYNSLLTMPEVSIKAKKGSGMLHLNGAMMLPPANKAIGYPSMTFSRVFSTVPQLRPYSSPKDCNLKEERKKGSCEKLGQQPCCEPKHRETCDKEEVHPQCSALEAPYPCFSDCNKGFPRIPVCECTEQERVYIKLRKAGAFNVRYKKTTPRQPLDPNCGTKLSTGKKYSTCADMFLIDPKDPASASWDYSEEPHDIEDKMDMENTSIKADMGMSAASGEGVQVDEDGALTVTRGDVDRHIFSTDAPNVEGEANPIGDSYVSEIASKMADTSTVGKGIFLRCLKNTGIFGRTPQANLTFVPCRNLSQGVQGGTGFTGNYGKKDDCKLSKDDEKKKCGKQPPQPCCDPKYRETCEPERIRPQCSPIDAPYASFSDCHRNFNLIPTCECSEQEKVFTRLRASGAYEIKNLQRLKKPPTCNTTPKRDFSNCPKKGDSPLASTQEVSEDSLKEMEEKQLAKKVLTTVKNGMEAIAVSTNDLEARKAYFQLYEDLEKLCEQEFQQDMHVNDDLEVHEVKQQPICSRDIFSDSCLNKNTVPSMADENLKQMMTIDAIKSFCASMFAIPTMSTTLYEESEKHKTEMLQKQLDELLDQYRAPKI